MSETHYIRVEGVNMTPFVLDTEDLSTIRGGGLLLLDAIHRVEEKFAKKIKVLSSGASVGLFKYQGDPDQIGRLVDDLRAEFDQDARWRHATILVDSVPARPGEFLDDRERLIARIRRRQLAAPSLAIPGQVGPMVNGSASDDTPESSAVCGIDQVRPAEGTPKKIKGETRPLSAATRARRDYGVDNKDSFYRKVLKRDLTDEAEKKNVDETFPEGKMRFARHFQDIAGGGGWGPLNDKMAVLYLDGNGFSGIQQALINAACEGLSGEKRDQAAIEAQQSFDATLKDYRAKFLRTLLEKATTDTDGAWKNGNDRARKDMDEGEDATTLEGRVRLETLLWGGDEIMMVMPAWQGWAVARLFLEESKDWAIEGHALHHALGLVFCNHKAPIHRVTALARALADHAKDKVGRDGSSLAYQVLESFDHLGAGPEAHFKGLCLDGASVRTLMLTAEAVNALDTHLPTLRGDGGLPQRQLKRLVRALFVYKNIEEAEKALNSLTMEHDTERALKSLLGTLSGNKPDAPTGDAAASNHEQEQKRKQKAPDDWHAWYHIEQLWDYVAPERPRKAGEEARA